MKLFTTPLATLCAYLTKIKVSGVCLSALLLLKETGVAQLTQKIIQKILV